MSIHQTIPFLFLIVQLLTTGQGFPTAANISHIFTRKTGDPWRQDLCPFINSKVYLRDLAEHVAVKMPQFVKVIIGPKDAGKSTGIVKLIPEWKQLGHMIVDLDLKGTSHSMDGKRAMRMISNQLMRQLIEYDFTSYGKIYECTRKHCGEHSGHKWNAMGVIVWMIVWVTRNTQFVYYLGATISAILSYQYIDQIRRVYRNFPKIFWMITVSIGLFHVFILGMWLAFPHILHEAAQPLNNNLENGDWTTLICYMNCITEARPSNRTILLIREIINFERDTLNECLRAMEKFKQNGMLFPIILETSDFLWFEVPAIKKSRSSFEPYLIREMTFDEGNEEVVMRNGMFNTSDYHLIYSTIGGHAGSYARLWFYIRYQKLTLRESLQKLKAQARMHLRSCLHQSKNITESLAALHSFKKNGYIHNTTELTPSLNYLIQCNILFFTGENVISQNKLMTIAIKEILNLEGDLY